MRIMPRMTRAIRSDRLGAALAIGRTTIAEPQHGSVDVAELSGLPDAGEEARVELAVMLRVVAGQNAIGLDRIVDDLARLVAGSSVEQLLPDLVAWAIAKHVSEKRIDGDGGALRVLPAGVAWLRQVGIRSRMPKSWEEAVSRHLLPRAFGHATEGPVRAGMFDAAEGLRALILCRAYRLRFDGPPSPARLRTALARIAVTAHGDPGLSPGAARLFAARLLREPRDPGTDRRLIAWLAAEKVGASGDSYGDLRTAIIGKYLSGGGWLLEDATEVPSSTVDPSHRRRGSRRLKPVASRPKSAWPRGAKSAAARGQLSLVFDQDRGGALPDSTITGAGLHKRDVSFLQPDAQPPDVATATLEDAAPDFVTAVQSCADACAQGWSGDRKAFISDIWRMIRVRFPQWAESEIEFKRMLVEAHRQNQLSLTYADLKDKASAPELQASAVAYMNSVWHYVRASGSLRPD